MLNLWRTLIASRFARSAIPRLEQSVDKAASQNVNKQLLSEESELISNIAHDIRTPLTSIRGYLESMLMNGGKMPLSEQQECMQIVLRNVDSLISLVNDLLQISKLGESAPPCRWDLCSVFDLVDAVVKTFHPIAEKRGVVLTTSGMIEDIQVRIDIKMMERALSNIVHNAIYYSHGRGQVVITVRIENGRAIISVVDCGVGIPEENLASLGRRFFRVDRDRSRSTGGNGLGLAIAHRILELHGGEIKIYSKLNLGTTVDVDLPLA